MTHHWTSTERLATEAQTKIIGKFCSRCRTHKKAEGGALLQAGSNRTRWVCTACLKILNGHKNTLFQGRNT
jgi:hypothetical protein